MDYVHHCVFCGWSRLGASPTILSPGCERCGCALRSSHTDAYEALESEAADDAPVPISPSLIRLAALALGALLIVAMVTAGWREGGFWIAVAGLGMGGLASLSLPYPARR